MRCLAPERTVYCSARENCLLSSKIAAQRLLGVRDSPCKSNLCTPLAGSPRAHTPFANSLRLGIDMALIGRTSAKSIQEMPKACPLASERGPAPLLDLCVCVCAGVGRTSQAVKIESRDGFAPPTTCWRLHIGAAWPQPRHDETQGSLLGANTVPFEHGDGCGDHMGSPLAASPLGLRARRKPAR